MTLNEQIGVYASVIVVMLTLLRIMSGITGSRAVRDAVLLSTVISTIALIGASAAKFLLEIEIVRLFLIEHQSVARNCADFWMMLWFILLIYYFGLGVILRLYVRSVRFKDWGVLGNLRIAPPAKFYRSWRRARKGDVKGYETNTPTNAHDAKTIKILEKHLGSAASKRHTLLLSGGEPWLIRKKLIELIIDLISNTKEEFNYVCCTISPDNLWKMIEKDFPDSELQKKLKRRLVFVDAYTETFGFGDEILTKRINSMKVDKGIEVVSCNSAAGVHKGTTDAFKILKNIAIHDKRERGACTVIYDSLSVLAIPETEAEVAEFVIHLSAAEHTYDMLTIFVEADLTNRDSISIDAMRACCGEPVLIEEG